MSNPLPVPEKLDSPLTGTGRFDRGSTPGALWHRNMPAVIINENDCCRERHFGREGETEGELD